jgi:hypothetical protein
MESDGECLHTHAYVTTDYVAFTIVSVFFPILPSSTKSFHVRACHPAGVSVSIGARVVSSVGTAASVFVGGMVCISVRVGDRVSKIASSARVHRPSRPPVHPPVHRSSRFHCSHCAFQPTHIALHPEFNGAALRTQVQRLCLQSGRPKGNGGCVSSTSISVLNMFYHQDGTTLILAHSCDVSVRNCHKGDPRFQRSMFSRFVLSCTPEKTTSELECNSC